MFGIKIMKKSSYNSLKSELSAAKSQLISKAEELRKTKTELNKTEADCNSLKESLKEASAINNAKANENGCMIGEWCSKCNHGKKMITTNYYYDLDSIFNNMKYADVNVGYYCAKHMKDICPEFEMTGK